MKKFIKCKFKDANISIADRFLLEEDGEEYFYMGNYVYNRGDYFLYQSVNSKLPYIKRYSDIEYIYVLNIKY